MARQSRHRHHEYGHPTPSFVKYFFFAFIAILAGIMGASFVVRGTEALYAMFRPAPLPPAHEVISQVEERNESISSAPILKEPITGLTATAYNVARLDTSESLIAKNSGSVYPIASLTKVVTAVVALDLLDQDKKVTITDAMLATEGTSGGLRRGEVLKVGELLYPLLMVSSNDAAEAIARAHGRLAFIQAMNAWVVSIGAKHTSFADPSGLSEFNRSSAEDMQRIMQWVFVNRPEIIDITHTKLKIVKTHTWVNPTHFLNLSSYIGGKNGFTLEALQTTASIFNLTSQGVPVPVMIVLLQSKDRSKDIEVILKYLEKNFSTYYTEHL